MDLHILGLGFLVFLARAVDVSLGTLRTIFLVQGRASLAFLLGFCEILVWVTVVTTVIQNVRDQPLLGVFFALGFASGNFLGIALERRLALGNVALKVFTRSAGELLAERLRDDGLRVTTFVGQGMRGPVTELYVVCRRRSVAEIIAIVRKHDPEAFYVTEAVREVNKPLQALPATATGWLPLVKKK